MKLEARTSLATLCRRGAAPLLASLAVLLSACGGGGGGNAPAAPVLTLTPQSVKTFAFTWDDVSGETQYQLLENPDGASDYTVVATLGANVTNHDLTVFLPARINASYILSACNSAGCTDSDEVSVGGTLAEAVGYVKASNTEGSDLFGFNAALSADGSTLAVGAPTEESNATGIDGDQTNNDAARSGAVYVFSRSAATWTQQAYVKASNTDAFDRFGTAIALAADGSTLAVGAPAEDSNAGGINGDQANNAADSSGAVYVFSRSGVTWSQQAYVKASNPQQEDRFGESVALSADGNTLAVGAPPESSNAIGINGDQTNNDADSSGAVYVFSRSAATWTQQAYVKASNTDAFDRFGTAVALTADGNTLAVSALQEESSATGINGDQANNGAGGSGAVYVFNRSGVTWSQQAYVKASNTGVSDIFGFSVALAGDGNTLAVGAPREDSDATGINGDQANNDAATSGAVYVFSRSGTTWSQQAYVKASNPQEGDRFGESVALSADGNTLAVGAPLEDSNAIGINGDQTNNDADSSGAVYVFSRSAATWTQQAYVKASNTDAGDTFGAAVSLSGDGQTLAVTASEEQSNAIGINGDQTNNDANSSGAVYLY